MTRISQFSSDLVRDLRDRRLLLPVAALLVALLAVPIALSKSPDSAPPPPLDAAAGEATAAQPAVLAEDEGIRNYRERLEAFKAKSPFRQQFKLPEVTSSALEDVPASGEVGGGSAAGATSTSPISSGDVAGAVLDSPLTNSSTPPSDTSTQTQTEVVTRRVTRLVSRRIDVKVGPQGDLKDAEGLGGLEVLPDDDAPVTAFLGTSADGKRAAFLVSADVGSTAGEGKCLPSPSDCQFVTLRQGEEQTFEYTPDGVTYHLKLVDIRNVKISAD